MRFLPKMPVESFLDAAFGGRFQFGLTSRGTATARIRVGELDCWKPSCRARTKIATGIDIVFGPNTHSLSVPQLGEHPVLFGSMLGHLPPDAKLGELKRRYSNTQEREYMSNGCYRCGSLVGEWYEIDAHHSEEIVCSFPISMSGEWRRVIEKELEFEPEWAVYSVGELEE